MKRGENIGIKIGSNISSQSQEKECKNIRKVFTSTVNLGHFELLIREYVWFLGERRRCCILILITQFFLYNIVSSSVSEWDDAAVEEPDPDLAAWLFSLIQED